MEIKRLLNFNKVYLSEYLEGKILSMENNTFLNKGKPYTHNAISTWKKFYKVWRAFKMSVNKKKICIEDITLNTYFLFMHYCDLCNYKSSTKYLYATIFKTALNYAYSEGVSKNKLFLNNKFVTHNTNSIHSNIYLNDEEIVRIEKLDLTGCKTLSKVRDLFLIGCYTGQRYSDYSSITVDDIKTLIINGKSYKIITKKQKKTGTEVLIPILHEEVFKILDKWGGHLPKVSISSINAGIKEICRLAGIDERVKKYEVVGGKEITTMTTKSRMVSSHTARRSCITNLYLEGKLNLFQIRSISGHKTEKSFMTYLCQTQEENARGIIESYMG